MFRKNFRLCVLSLLCVLTLCFSLHVTAAGTDGHITVDTVSASGGDSVIIPIRIEDNPGIMAITVSLTYDKDALEYEKFYRGYLKDYTVVDHPDKGIVRFVNCESGNRDDNDIMISLQFKVKEDAAGGLHKVSVSYKSGDFCDWSLKKLMPEITSGGVKVSYTETNCSHDEYGEWTVAAEPACTEPGARQRQCVHCGHMEIEEVAAIGHTFSEEWTVDQPATKDSDGMMSRHCLRCNATVDTLTFSLPEAEKENLKNEANAEVKPSAFTEKLVKEQIPEEQRQHDDILNNPAQNENTDEEINDAPKPDMVDQAVEEILENQESTLAAILNNIPNPAMTIKRILGFAVFLVWLLFFF